MTSADRPTTPRIDIIDLDGPFDGDAGAHVGQAVEVDGKPFPWHLSAEHPIATESRHDNLTYLTLTIVVGEVHYRHAEDPHV